MPSYTFTVHPIIFPFRTEGNKDYFNLLPATNDNYYNTEFTPYIQTP